MGFCPVASSVIPMAFETEAFSGRPFVATVDSSAVDSLFVKVWTLRMQLESSKNKRTYFYE